MTTRRRRGSCRRHGAVVAPCGRRQRNHTSPQKTSTAPAGRKSEGQAETLPTEATPGNPGVASTRPRQTQPAPYSIRGHPPLTQTPFSNPVASSSSEAKDLPPPLTQPPFSQLRVPHPDPAPTVGLPLPRRAGVTRYPRWGAGRGNPLDYGPTGRKDTHPLVAPHPDPVPTVGLPLPRRAGVTRYPRWGAGRARQPPPTHFSSPPSSPSYRTPIRYPRWAAGCPRGRPAARLPPSTRHTIKHTHTSQHPCRGWFQTSPRSAATHATPSRNRPPSNGTTVPPASPAPPKTSPKPPHTPPAYRVAGSAWFRESSRGRRLNLRSQTSGHSGTAMQGQRPGF